MLFCGSAVAQSRPSATTLTATVQQTDGKPVDYFTATVLSLPDSTLLGGAACMEGKLQLEIQATGDALLRLSCVGYDDQNIPLTLHDGENDLDAITMQANTTLQAVTVSAHRPTIISKADRTIVNVEGSVLSSALDGQDMLKKTPGLTVDKTGNLVVFGKGAPIIYIDNKEVNSATEIQMLNPKNIKSIEVIDNPSAAYDAQGAAVVLIHTLKHDDSYFVRIGGSLQQGRRFGGTAYAEGAISQGKINADLYYGYLNSNRRAGEDYHYTPDNIYQIFGSDMGINHSQTHEYDFSFSYNPAPNRTIGIQSSGYRENSNGPGNQDTWSDDPSLQAFHTYSQSNYKPWELDGTLYYNWDIDTLGQSFKFVADATKMNTKRSQPYYNVFEGAPMPENPFINTNDNNGTDVLYSLKADYVKPIGKVWKIETGAKYYYIGNDTHTVQTGTTNSTQNYKSREWNVAGYLSISTQVSDKINLRYGLRAEYNRRKGWNDKEQYVNMTALDWFPSFLVDYAASDNFNVGLSYTKRLDRPPLDELDPSLYVDSLYTLVGNPDLKSEKSHVFQLTVGFLKDFNLRASYNYNINPTYFTITTNADDPRIMDLRYTNRHSSKSWSVSLGYNKDIGKWWTTSTYVGIAGSEYKYIDAAGIARNNNRPRWNINTINTFHLPWQLEWDVGFLWNSAGSVEDIRSGSTYNLYTTLRRDFLDGRLSCQITANDLFHRSMNDWQQTVLPGRHWNLYNADSRYVVLSITYKFGKSKHQYQSMSGSAEEQGRL